MLVNKEPLFKKPLFPKTNGNKREEEVNETLCHEKNPLLNNCNLNLMCYCRLAYPTLNTG